MYDCITLTVPAKESALMVVRLTAAGVAARSEMDLETLDDIKTAVYEACYAMTVQKYVPEQLAICFSLDGCFSVSVCGQGSWRETDGRVPDVKLCNAVLTTMIPNVKVEMDQKAIRCIHMHR